MVVLRDGCPDAGASLLPLQPVERTAESTLESSGEGDRLESRPILAHADILVILHGEVQSSGDGLPGSY